LRAGNKPTLIGGIVENVVRSVGLHTGYCGWQVVEGWSEIVGEYYAKKSRAIRFQNGVLYVAVPDSSWRQMMSMDSEKILKSIHRLPHGRAVKELRLVAGEKGL